ncbi:uncharacterized, partial [Tachysurus ichikawai]
EKSTEGDEGRSGSFQHVSVATQTDLSSRWSVSMLLPATLLLLHGAVGLNRQVIQDNPHILNVHIKRPVLLNSETEAEAVFTVSG